MEVDLVLRPKDRLRIVGEEADAVTLSPAMLEKPVRLLHRSAMLIRQQAAVYANENELETAYKLYTRFIALWVHCIRRHKQFDTLPQKDVKTTRQQVEEAFATAEELKARLLAKYESEALVEVERRKVEEEERAKREAEARRIAAAAVLAASLPSAPPAYSDVAKRPDVIADYPAFGGTGSPAKDATLALPTVDRSLKPSSSFSSSSNCFTPQQNRYGLRTVLVPKALVALFLGVARENTARNVETCGILCAKLTQNRLEITHLLIPEQSGTADSCTTSNEEALFEYQDARALLTVGWIHTHPTQTAFLSSVDLHTHYAYQIMLPEAIAIVCSPKFDDVGIFMLTPVTGMEEITNCRQTGFHPHRTEPALFETCDHAQYVDGAPCELVDLRRRK